MAKLLWFVLSIISLSSCAQVKSTQTSQDKSIQNSYAYTRKVFSGTISVDVNGNPTSSGVRTTHFVYLETKAGVVPQWEKAWIKNEPYSINTMAMTEDSVKPGTVKDTEKPVVIKAAAGNRLWRLQLTPLTSEKSSGAVINNTSTDIVIEGKLNNKKLTHTIANETELSPVRGL